MHKIYTLLLAAFLINVSTSHANNRLDSIGVENNKGKKVIIYKVEPKETYYSISKKFNVNYKDVMEFNDSQFLQVGVILKIPTNVPFSGAATNVPSSSNSATVAYVIKAKDNLNMLAEKYGTTVNEIKRINNLSSINLQIGQVLKIPNAANLPEETTTGPSKVEPLPTATVAPANAVEIASALGHTVKAKENLNLIAQKYGTTVDLIKSLNGLTSNNLQIGQLLKIPSANDAESIPSSTTIAETPSNSPVYTKKSNNTPVKPVVTNEVPVSPATGTVEHTVLAGETIYSIAKKYGATTYQIKTANNLTTNDLNVGQRLTIKSSKPLAVNEVVETDTDTESNAATIKDPALKGPASKYGLSQVEEKGTAIWIADQDLDPTKMLVLHRTVPVGTIIKITNPMSNRSTFAKVVGKFTENESTKDVIIVMTKAVADAVGALDKRFFCNINYGALENEQ